MQKKRKGSSSAVLAAIGVGCILIGISNLKIPAGANYGPVNIVPIPPTPPPVNRGVQTIDVTNSSMAMPPSFGPNLPPAIAGVAASSRGFSSENLSGPLDFLLVQLQNPGADKFEKQSPYAGKLSLGTVLASVKKPSKMGVIITPIAEIGFSANSDAFVQVQEGSPVTGHMRGKNPLRAVAYLEGQAKGSNGYVVRVRNVDGLGETIKVKLTSGANAGKFFTVQPGYEMVVADHKLTREESRPGDGILRRKTQVMLDGTMAVSQFSVESALQQSALVSKLASQQTSDSKSKRIVSDMSRMAAVLNQVNGTQGFGR